MFSLDGGLLSVNAFLVFIAFQFLLYRDIANLTNITARSIEKGQKFPQVVLSMHYVHLQMQITGVFYNHQNFWLLLYILHLFICDSITGPPLPKCLHVKAISCFGKRLSWILKIWQISPTPESLFFLWGTQYCHCKFLCQSADIMSSLCGVGVRVRVNNFSSKTTRPRDVLFFLKDTLSIEDEKVFKASKSVCSSVC